MKYSHKMRLKRSVSAVLAASMAMSVFSTVPVYAETGTTTYNYDGYKVDYTVTNEWFGNQSVNVTLTNTGDESILNWALGYDANGEINGIWNGYVYSQTDEDYIIKNSGYNYEIEPYQSVNFGYTLSGYELEVPEKFELCSKRVDKTEGYDVKLNVTGDWGDGFQGELVVTNTSDYPLEAWKVDFDSNFEINNLWNGKIIDSDDDSYSIASCMWTNPIASGASTVIGFTAGKENSEAPAVSNVKLSEVIIDRNSPEAPEEPVIPSEDILEISADAQYIESDGTAVISWDTNVDNGTFEVLYSQDNIEYTQAASISGERSYTYSLGETYGTVYFKVRQTTEGGQTAETSVVSVDIPVPVVPEKPVVTVSAEFDAETGYANVSWETTAEGGSFDIYVSVDSSEFTKLASVTDAVSYSFAPEVSGSYDIKVVQTTASEMTGESNVVNVICTVADPNEPSEEIDWSDSTDTDNDDLKDVYEKHYFETDPENADTDGDGLPDGYEVYYLGTDPKKADSDDNGVSDGEEDFDKDGLNNHREYELGTDPNNADSDADGLTDSDEISKYSTDPLKYDSDEDGISDGDEAALGLDPNSASTDGVSDSEHTIKQHIGADSENLSAVNTEENPFKVSIDITAAGVAANNLSARESAYSNAIKNDAILGISPEFLYTDGLKVEDVVINFDIDSSATANTNGKYTSLSDEFVGIKRLNVFKYFEDTNMLLPIETFHDIESGRVYTHVDELGTYCLMDMEVWLENLGIVASGFSTASVSASDAKSNDASEEENSTDDAESEEKECLDVVLIAYPNNGILDLVKTELVKTCGMIFDEADNLGYSETRIYLVSFFGDPLQVSDDKLYVENIDEATTVINRIYSGISANINSNSYMLTRAVNCVNDTLYEDFRSNSEKYCVFIDAISSPACSYEHYGIEQLKEKNINVYFECNSGNENYSKYLMLATDAICGEIKIEKGRYNFGDFIIEQIFGDHENEYPIISAVGWKRINLDAPITEEYRNHSFVIENDPSLRYDIISNYEVVDTDGDELYDFEEIMFQTEKGNDLITFDKSGNAVLPNFEDCTGALPWNRRLFYVEEGLRRYADLAVFQDFYKLRVLPIKSDPTSEDSDGDDIDDEEETFIGTSCLSNDTDKDGLDDCTEYINWYDPLDPNPDGDIYGDYEEFINGTNPYALDFTAEAWAAEFVKGVVAGDIIEDPSIPALVGQIAGGIAPGVGTVADVRDTIVNASRGDWGMAAMSAVGIVPVGGDLTKAAANITQFIAKNGDNTSQIAELIIICSAKSSTTFAIRRASFDDIFKLLPESSFDELFEIYKKGDGKISRKHYLQVIEAAKKAGKEIPTIADDFPDATKIDLEGVWNDGPWTRGSKIDESLNGHKIGKGLGETFPVADRVKNKTLISTKSIDLGAKTYLDPEKLSKRIEAYIEQLEGFEDKYPKVKKEGLPRGKDPITGKAREPLKITDYTSKQLELALPDIPITEAQASVIRMYALDYNISIVIVRG